MSNYGIPFDSNPSTMPQRPKSAKENMDDLKTQMLNVATIAYIAFIDKHPIQTGEATTVLIRTMAAIKDEEEDEI